MRLAFILLSLVLVVSASPARAADSAGSADVVQSERVKELVDALGDDAARAAAEAELLRIGAPAVKPLIVAAAVRPVLVQEAAIRVLRSMSAVAAPVVVELFQREDERISRFAGMLLAELREPGVVPELVRLLRERRAYDESDVVRALAVHDSMQARVAVLEAMESPFAYLRAAAVKAVRQWKDADGARLAREPLIRRAAGDDSIEVRVAALRTVLTLWMPDAEPLLTELLEDEDTPSEVFEAAAEAFGFMAGFRERDTLLELYDRPKRKRQRAAMARALRRITYRPEDAGPEIWQAEPPAWTAHLDGLDLDPIKGLPGGALPAWTEGDHGPVLIVFPGLPDFRHDALAPWLECLEDDYQIVAVELPEVPAEPTRAAAWEQEVLRGVEVLRAHLGVLSATVMGHGPGGVLAARYAARYPERVDYLLLVGVPGFHRAAFHSWQAAVLRRQGGHVAADLKALTGGLVGAEPRSRSAGAWRVFAPALFHRPEQAVVVRERSGPADLGGAVLTALGPFDARPDMMALRTPVLWVVGSEDYVDEETLAAWKKGRAALAGARHHVRIPEAGHFVFMEQPAVFAKELRAWLPKREDGSAL